METWNATVNNTDMVVSPCARPTKLLKKKEREVQIAIGGTEEMNKWLNFRICGGCRVYSGFGGQRKAFQLRNINEKVSHPTKERCPTQRFQKSQKFEFEGAIKKNSL